MNKWISVNRRLPEGEKGKWSEEVIALSDDLFIYQISYFNGSGGETGGCWQRPSDFVKNGSKKIIGWIPMPEITVEIPS